jgi:Family of unknown function (DUF5427)
MPPKSTKPTNDELLAQFDDLGIDTKESSDQSPTKPSSTDAPKAAEKDPLAELETLASQRPSTPRLSAEARRSKPSSGRTSEDKSTQHKSEDATPAPARATVEDEHSPEKVTAPAVAADEESKSSGGGWWGGFLSTASAAMKQAEAAVKEIQKNEEAQKWAEQVRGNVGALRDLGMFIIHHLSSFSFGRTANFDVNRRRAEDSSSADFHIVHSYARASDFFA